MHSNGNSNKCKSQDNWKKLKVNIPETVQLVNWLKQASYLFSYADKLGQCTLVYFLVKASGPSFESFTLEKRVGYSVVS